MWECPSCGEELEDNFDVCWNCQTIKDGVEVQPDEVIEENNQGQLREETEGGHKAKFIVWIIVFVLTLIGLNIVGLLRTGRGIVALNLAELLIYVAEAVGFTTWIVNKLY